VVAGNHRDAWVYGAVDPGSGTTAMLEAVHGLGALLKSGWKPRRTVVIGSWDGEEQALVGSTEWGEQNAQALANAVAYFNIDVGVSGKNFGASAEPTLKEFIRNITKAVPSPQGGTVYEAWHHAQPTSGSPQPDVAGVQTRLPVVQVGNDVPVGDLGSGSDYSVFLQHLGVPSTDMGSTGSYGVYHSAFDDFAWFTKFGDPTFVYEQQMARVYGLEIVRMADAEVLPYDFETYGKEIEGYIDAARKKATTAFPGKAPDFGAATDAARRFTQAGQRIAQLQSDPHADAGKLNRAMHQADLGLLLPDGLPNRPWFRHAIYAPGEYTGYAAVVIPGVSEAIDAKDLARTQQQLAALTAAINRAAAALESYR
jgi:N-acetylated-alpha-linked acidic dipeptidase